MDKICVNCGTAVPERAKFCRKCRSQEFQTMQRCDHCNAAIHSPDINFCPTCGRRLTTKEVNRQYTIEAPDADPHFCEICRQAIHTDLVFCPGCTNAFHFNHLSSWILDKSACPVCKTTLRIKDKQS